MNLEDLSKAHGKLGELIEIQKQLRNPSMAFKVTLRPDEASYILTRRAKALETELEALGIHIQDALPKDIQNSSESSRSNFVPFVPTVVDSVEK